MLSAYKKILLLLIVLFTQSLSFAQAGKEETSDSSSSFIDNLKHQSEASLVQVTGNTESESYSAKQKTSYTQDLNSYTLMGSYLRTKANSTETARSWDTSLRYERELSTMWSAFLQQGAESDVYSGYVQRDNSDIGGKYFIIKSEPKHFLTELGYRYIKTYSTLGQTTYVNSARLYLEYAQSLNESVRAQVWIEYLPNFKDSDAYLINYEPSLSVMLSKVFSLKVSRLTKYQNVPPAGKDKKEDVRFTTSLVANF